MRRTNRDASAQRYRTVDLNAESNTEEAEILSLNESKLELMKDIDR